MNGFWRDEVMENSLVFFQTVVEKLIAKEDELQISGADVEVWELVSRSS